METVSQSRLYRLAKRLSLGRFLRYLDLWARYGWRWGQSALSTRLRRQPRPPTPRLWQRRLAVLM